MDRTDYCFGRIDPFDNKTPYRCALRERGFAPGCKFSHILIYFHELESSSFHAFHSFIFLSYFLLFTFSQKQDVKLKICLQMSLLNFLKNHILFQFFQLFFIFFLLIREKDENI
jgi:hypothetical protein